MTNIRKTIHNVFVWAYARGTLQYDIICALILAFIFLVPRSCFVSKYAGRPHANYPNAGASVQNLKASTPR